METFSPRSKRCLLIVSLMFLYIHVNSQTVLKKETHIPVDKDVLEMKEVSFIDPGDGGERCLWDFSHVIQADRESRIRYRVPSDTLLFCFGSKMQSVSMLKGDSVFLKQYENRLSLMRDSIDCIFMRYPMSYGDVIESPYCFTGVYGRHNSLIADGTIRTEADGYGTLVVPGDTLYNVLRVRRKIDADVFVGKLQEADRDTPATSSQFHYCRDFYQWYSDGYRYPLVESDVSVFYYNESEISANHVSYLYTPEMQEYDLANSRGMKNDRLLKLRNNDKQAAGHDYDVHTGKIERLDAAYSDGTSIEINYKVVSGDVDVEATLFDVEGRIYGHIEPHVISEGTVYERLECGKLRYGRYILNVKAGEKVVTRLISVD